MEINDNPEMKTQWNARTANRGKRMSEKENSPACGDEVETNTGVSERANFRQEVRADVVERARANIESGHYDEPEVVDEIVDRLMDQFGL
ncbi:MAG TPA: hypothetical protein ENO22_05015 [candidate division Zixibacteria bacterium]|nr:hypothetical protein [candidate division Zixibacteria bacterium]HEQ98684.1 hypothetical protein [candidate division Zixibacteria bacterium]